MFFYLQEYWSASIVKNKKFSEAEKIIKLLFLFLQEYWSASIVQLVSLMYTQHVSNCFLMLPGYNWLMFFLFPAYDSIVRLFVRSFLRPASLSECNSSEVVDLIAFNIFMHFQYSYILCECTVMGHNVL